PTGASARRARVHDRCDRQARRQRRREAAAAHGRGRHRQVLPRRGREHPGRHLSRDPVAGALARRHADRRRGCAGRPAAVLARRARRRPTRGHARDDGAEARAVNLDELRLIHPELALLALVAVPIGLLYLATFVARRRALARFAGRGARLSSVSGARQGVRAVLVILAVATLAFAAAGPFVDLREVQVRWHGVDLVVALDVSQSMAVKDVQPDRLHAARDAIRSLVQAVPGTRVALVLFGANGILRYPPTTDPAVITDALDSPGRTFRPTNGSSLRAAIDAAVDAFATDSVLPKAVLGV